MVYRFQRPPSITRYPVLGPHVSTELKKIWVSKESPTCLAYIYAARSSEGMIMVDLYQLLACGKALGFNRNPIKSRQDSSGQPVYATFLPFILQQIMEYWRRLVCWGPKDVQLVWHRHWLQSRPDTTVPFASHCTPFFKSVNFRLVTHVLHMNVVCPRQAMRTGQMLFNWRSSPIILQHVYLSAQ